MRLQSYLIYYFLLFLVSSATHTGSATTQVYTQTTNFVGTGGKTLCKVEFEITGSTRSFLAILYAANGASNALSSNILYYFHKNPKSLAQVDLQNAITGKKQTVQFISSAGSPIFIQLLVASTIGFTYTITITELLSTSFTSGCLNPTALQSVPNPFCSSCTGSFNSGAYCSFLDISLSNNTQRTQAIAAGNYVAFTIPSSTGTITLNYAVDQPMAEVFIQFKTFSGEVAGLANMAATSNGYAAYLANNPALVYQTTINSGGSDISVGVISQGGISINFTIWYTTESSVNLLIIILGVLGGILLIVLIIAACCIIKRMRSPSQMIHPNASVIALQVQAQQNMLSPEQIEMYFPSVSCRIVFGDLQSSTMNLNSSKQDLNIDKDCVICLCPVDVNQLMKVTYCRHIFHSHCLVEWFKKQRNCPYCREEYSKSSTIEHYQHLLKDAQKNILAGPQLAKSILISKVMKSSLVVEELKD